MRRFLVTTTPWLPQIHARWRAAAGASEPVESLPTVVFGRIAGGRPLAVQLNRTETCGRLECDAATPMAADGRESFVGAHGVVDEQLRAATTPYALRHAAGLAAGLTPRPRPGSQVEPQDLLLHAYQLLDGAISRQAAVPRPPYWPPRVPVLGDQPVLRALDL